MSSIQTGDITIQPVEGKEGRKAFINAARPAYAGDPNWVAPLEFEIDARLNPKSNPSIKDAPLQLWVAYRNGEPVGRIAALVNPAHIARYQDDTGHFGFLDAIDDPAVFAALLNTAEDWLRGRGMKRIAGPFNLSVNEEVGMLIDGFDTPPYVMMPHGRAWYPAHTKAAGYAKLHDMHALHYINERQFIPERRQKFVDRAIGKQNVFIRNIDFKKFREDIDTIIDIYNDAWSDNWGYIPFTAEQAAHMASELRPIITKHNVVLCYLNDEPVAFGLVLPNINEAIRDFDGKLLPFNWAKLLWRLKVKGLTEARMPLMGVRKRLHGKPVGAAFAYKIIDLVNSSNIDRGLESSEVSWILEDNEPMLNMLTEMGCRIYKTYRIFDKAL